MSIPFYLLCGLLLDVDYHDVFISCLDSNSDGTVHCKVSIGEHVKQCYLSPSVLFKKETHWVACSKFPANVYFWVNYPLKQFSAAKCVPEKVSVLVRQTERWTIIRDRLRYKYIL